MIDLPKNNDDKNWSLDDVDRLLSRTEKPAKKQDEKIVENFARTMRLADTVNIPTIDIEKQTRVEDVHTKKIDPLRSFAAKEKAEAALGSPASVNAGDIEITSKTAKQRIADIVKEMKKGKKNSGFSSADADFSEPLIPHKTHAMETDKNRRRFLEDFKVEDEPEEVDDKTKVVERPGFVIKKGEGQDLTGELEAVPTLIEADDAIKEFEEEEAPQNEENWDDGQIKFNGFDSADEPENISESEAEMKLLKRRREKIDKFKLMGIAEAEEENKNSDGKIEMLFGREKTKKDKSRAPRKGYTGAEYTDEKDADRLRATIHKAKKMSKIRLAVYTLSFLAMSAIGIFSCIKNGFDTLAFQVVSLALLLLCTFTGITGINKGVAAALKKEANMQSAAALAVMAALIQNISAIILGKVLSNETFVFSAAAAGAMMFGEYGAYLRTSRTYDAFNFCTGKHKNSLYSVQEIENENEEFEIGRTLLMDSPDIRYSCRAKFPSRLIERCESGVSSDKLAGLLLTLSLIAGVVCGAVAGAASKNFFTAINYACAAICVCVPAFGTAAIQLPMRWANKRLNKAGGVIMSQNSIEDYSKANAVVLDSAELFDPKGCRMHGFKDFKRVRVDDIMLYAAAMVVKSGGPLTDVFDQVVSKRELLPQVHSFNYEDRMGISGWINGQKVIMGNRNMMKHHNFELPSEDEELRYSHDGRRVIYLAIANSLAAMLVVSYAPNKKLRPFIKRLGTDGVTILLRNCDSNITTDMINEVFGARFTNIRLINNTAGRVFKKYRRKIKENAKSGIIHDGEAFSLLRSFTMSYTLCGTFKVENLIQLINVALGFLLVGVFAVLDLLSVTGVWPLVLFQLLMSFAAFFTARIRGIF